MKEKKQQKAILIELDKGKERMEKIPQIIKINFCDMSRDFNPKKNMFVDIILEYFMGFELSKTPDFLIYSCFGTEHHKYRNCVKIFYTGEAITPNFNECDYAIAFDKINFGKRYCRRPLWLLNENRPSGCQLSDEDALNRKFCNFIYSNDKNGNAVNLRIKFAKRLMQYKKVDCPGKVLNNMRGAIVPRDGDWTKGKLDFIKDYKFTIAFENSLFDGYTTEKMLDPLSVHSIPIYWGNPSVTEDFNEKAFINCNGLEQQLDKIVETIIEIDNNDKMYLRMLHENPMTEDYDFNERKNMNNFLLNIFKTGNVPYQKDPMNFVYRMSFGNLSRKDKLLFILKSR